MSVLVVGISHKSAPVSLLERVALDAHGVHKLIDDVAACEHVTEATVIATCNRLEIYAEVDRFHGSVEEVSRLVVERAGESTEAMLPHLYVHYDDGAVSHLFQVVAGLDSMALGEGQILGQTRDAPQLRAGDRHRRPRPERAVPAGAARRQAGARRDRHRPGRPVAGDGRPGPQPRRRRRPVPATGCSSSARARWRELATATASPRRGQRHRGQPDRRQRRPPRGGVRRPPGRPRRPGGRLAIADVVVSCTRATGTIVTRPMVEAAVSSGRELVILDLALPTTSIPPSRRCRGHPGQPGRAGRRAARLRRRPRGRAGPPDRVPGGGGVPRGAPAVERHAHRGRPPVDGHVGRRRRDGAARGASPRPRRRHPRRVLHAVRRVADKLLHQPTVRVKELANETGAVSYADALARLFALDQDAVEAVVRPEGLS